MIASESSVSSCAQVALAARMRSTPRSSWIGRVRAAMRVPTAADQSRAEMGEVSMLGGTRSAVSR